MFDLGTEPCELRWLPMGPTWRSESRCLINTDCFVTTLVQAPIEISHVRTKTPNLVGDLITAGERILYRPSAVAYHPVVKDRIRKDYFLTWWFDYGRALIRERGSEASRMAYSTALSEHSKDDRNLFVAASIAMDLQYKPDT